MKLDAICARLKDSLSKEQTKEDAHSEDNNNDVKDAARDCSPVPEESRRNRRKNVKPRALVQFAADDSTHEDEEEAVEATCSGDDGNISRDEEALGEQELNDNGRHINEDTRSDDDAPMDLSTASRASSEEGRLTGIAIAAAAPKKMHGEETMTTYAESTMKELLSMYGFDNEEDASRMLLPSAGPSKQLPPVDAEDDQLPPNGLEDEEEEEEEKPATMIAESPKLTKASAASSSNFATSAAYINACFDPKLGPALANSQASKLLPTYNKYIRRYLSAKQCGQPSCLDMNYKEHFHCLDCTFKLFLKKEEMIRHFKWHKKRDDSLQHGFLRFSPHDDCSMKFPSPCAHNGKQTHYHCIQPQCSKVYISTSDVQLHANYHRKDSAIIQEGFQRFRATEDCGSTSCQFNSQRTTHFHCRREGCSFTFKNKADMEKHKTYHQKDELLAKDGFKKFMKYEHCAFDNCQYSKVSNHIHCIRPGCNFVLHSTGQLYSHKRKHERRDLESVYKEFKETKNSSSTSSPMRPIKPKIESEFVDLEELVKMEKKEFDSDTDDSNPVPTSLVLNQFAIPHFKEEEMESGGTDESPDEAQTIRTSSPQTAVCKIGFVPKISPPVNHKRERDESWKKYLTRYTANDPCHSRCQFLYKDHYHCTAFKCGMLFRSKDGVREHARHHDYQDRITELSFRTYGEGEECDPPCRFNKGALHYHCLWGGCNEAVSSDEHTFMRLEHYKVHEFARTSVGARKMPTSIMKEQGKKRRGRPPKYPRNEVVLVPKIGMTEKEIEDQARCFPSDHPIAFGFRQYKAMEPCPDDRCLFHMKDHFHCVRQRCHHSTDRRDMLTMHAKDFHNFILILDGFEFFDRHINCRRPHCHNNRANRHYHCVRPKCDYSFVRYSTMAQHDKKHKMAEMGLTPSPSIGIPNAVFLGGNQPNPSMVSPLVIPPPPPLMMACNNQMMVMPPKTVKTEPVPIAPKPSPSDAVQMLSVNQQLSMLLQKKASMPQQQADWPLMSKMYFSQTKLCGRPFCKLKKREHYHCFECNQAFSDRFRLKGHVTKHGVKINVPENHVNAANLHSSNEEEDEEEDVSSSLNLNPNAFSNLLKQGQRTAEKEANGDEDENDDDSLVMDLSQKKSESKAEEPFTRSRRSGRKRRASKILEGYDTEEHSPAPPQKKKPLIPSSPSPPPPQLKEQAKADELLPGYQRFKFTEDCAYEGCPYRYNLSHYHCLRSDCGYAFCDRARLQQHTDRHKRLDAVMGDDFQQFRPKVDCNRPDCEHAKTANHFHCLRCPFICTESSKVQAHRKHHQKMDGIQAKGFQKFPASRKCAEEECVHSNKTMHYHCTRDDCSAVALGPTQMESHNLVHQNSGTQ